MDPAKTAPLDFGPTHPGCLLRDSPRRRDPSHISRNGPRYGEFQGLEAKSGAVSQTCARRGVRTVVLRKEISHPHCPSLVSALGIGPNDDSKADRETVLALDAGRGPKEGTVEPELAPARRAREGRDSMRYGWIVAGVFS